MTKPAAARPPGRTTADGPVEAADFDELRALIVGPEQRQLRALEARLDDPSVRTREVSRVLPQAFVLRKDDPQLTRALAPAVEETITASVRRNPRPLADALFPIFGPAIRKAIAAALRGMIDSLNQTLEHSLSWRAIGWRLEALRTGKSFAEIIVAHTLLYRVEQVFLIERDSGLLLLHVHAGGGGGQDADMISGMLTAIRDFARDSFKVSEDEALDALQVGGLSVWIEQAPHAVLAAVIRGTAPPDLRVSMQETLEHIHARLGDRLAAFDGDTEPFEAVRPALEGLLQSQYRTPEKKSHRMLWVFAGAAVLALAVWAAFAWTARQRWNGYLTALRAEPGIVVISTDRRGGQYVVAGLRDPLARDPSTLLAPARLDAADVRGEWQLYQALDPPLVVARARQLLRAPAGIDLRFADGVLTAGGVAPAAWILDSQRLASMVPGVVRYDAAPAIEGAVQTVARELEATRLLFRRGTMDADDGQDAVLAQQLERLRTLDALAAAAGRRYTVEFVGHADSDGPTEANDPLSANRAATVRRAAETLGLARLDFASNGVGSREPETVSADEAAKRANRRVSTHVRGIR